MDLAETLRNTISSIVTVHESGDEVHVDLKLHTPYRDRAKLNNLMGELGYKQVWAGGILQIFKKESGHES